MKKEKLIIKAHPKEISLIINIVNRIFNMEDDWTFIAFGKRETGIMVPKGYFAGAEMERVKNADELPI